MVEAEQQGLGMLSAPNGRKIRALFVFFLSPLGRGHPHNSIFAIDRHVPKVIVDEFGVKADLHVGEPVELERAGQRRLAFAGKNPYCNVAAPIPERLIDLAGPSPMELKSTVCRSRSTWVRADAIPSTWA